MSLDGRLQRYFPGPAIAVPSDVANDVDFQATLTQTLCKMSRQEAKEMKATAQKSGNTQMEDRETSNPALITEFLMSWLESTGEPVSVPQVWKNTRDEVCWSGGLRPWRRSPIWLLARVSMQLAFGQLLPSEGLYKESMLFFMSRILDLACERGTSADIIHCIISKVSKRLAKLNMGEMLSRPVWLSTVEASMTMAHQTLQNTWSGIMASADPRIDVSSLTGLKFAEDCATSLPELDAYLQYIKKPPPDSPFCLTFRPPSLLSRFPPGLPSPSSLPSGDGSLYVLAGFEMWVSNELDPWMKIALAGDDTCRDIGRVIQHYHKSTLGSYESNPEAMSVMILTCLELWVACDKSACHLYPLLLDYDPGIPQQLLQSLLLPLKADMERLLRMEQYLDSRRSKSISGYPSIFGSFGGAKSFAVRYFDSSQFLRNLLDRIETQARREREEKKQELVTLKSRYDNLMRKFESSFHDSEEVYVLQHRRYMSRHPQDCKKCAYRTEAQRMTIELHEWPLPTKPLEAQAIVFEIGCPRAFDDWRDATMYLILDVLYSDYGSKARPANDYEPDHCLREFIRHRPQRFKPVSGTKPHKVTHRASLTVSLANEENVCVNNGMQYEYIDTTTGTLVVPMKISDKIPTACTYQLQQSKSLQDFLCRPHTRSNGLKPNVVISRQSTCPTDMSLEEFKALAVLPLGVKIQWLNLLVQLHMPSVDLKKLDTNLAILQIIRQAGPPCNGDVAREGHQDLQDEIFGRCLLKALETAVERFKENWESCLALGGLIAIATRLLSLTPSDAIVHDCLDFLRSCRRISRGWALSLQKSARSTSNHNRRDRSLLKAFEISHICASTFDMDQHYLEDELRQWSHGSLFLGCAITIQETTHTALTDCSLVSTIRHQRWVRLASRAFPILVEEIKWGNKCINMAIQRSWAGFLPGTTWKCHSADAQHWMTSNTAQTPDSGSQTVHFNLLSGELLVDGLPLSRLPSSFEQHPSYVSLFGRSTIEVMPTKVAGMQFSAMKPFRGYEIYFGLHNRDLRVTCIEDNERYDFIPHRLFEGKMPTHFVTKFAHWLRHSTNTIVFRRISTPWEQPENPWVLSRTDDAWHLCNANEDCLVNMSSPTGKSMHGMLGSLEAAPFIQVFLRHENGQLEVTLPRLNLGFFLVEGSEELASHQFRGLHVSTSTPLGTLVGLKSKLVLRDSQNRVVVLIPNGDVTYHAQGNHISVEVQLGTSTKVRSYQIDRLLGRIVDDGTLESKLGLCYLHALTSFCLPDELTKKTGTEQALEILNSAAVRSFDGLSTKNANTLRAIAKLTPIREFYPAHVRTMQQVTWVEGLSFLSQHGQLFTQVASILAHASSLEFFYEGDLERLKMVHRGDVFLIERDLIRSAVFRSSTFGAKPVRSGEDNIYTGRGSTFRDRYNCALKTSTRIFQGLETRQTLRTALLSGLWELLSNGLGKDGQMLNAGTILGKELMRYDATRLLDWRALLAVHWCQIHRALHSGGHSKYDVMMFLATISFSSDIEAEVLDFLMAMFNSTAVGGIAIPNTTYFELNAGREASLKWLTDTIVPYAREIYVCPEIDLPRNPSESKQQAFDRRGKTFHKNKWNAINGMARNLNWQWPCQKPPTPTDSTFQTYIDVDNAMVEIRKRFKLWWDNLQFYKYLGQLETALCTRRIVPLPGSRSSVSVPTSNPVRHRAYLMVDDLFTKHPAVLALEADDVPKHLVRAEKDKDVTLSKKLLAVIDVLDKKASLQHEKAYVDDLRRSATGLQTLDVKYTLTDGMGDIPTVLKQHVQSCERHLARTYKMVTDALDYTKHVPGGGIAATYNGPRVSCTFLVQQLSRKRWKHLSAAWKSSIITYGLAITGLQRAYRLLSLCGNTPDLVMELLNPGHENWHPHESPESLLMEIESGILIRKVQADIAEQMKNPLGKHNVVMQLNMGEGKSSVIVPVVAAALAEGTKLVRVVVGKAQSKQMLETLISKLSGLCDRQIYHLRFSRALKLGPEEVTTIDRTLQQCMKEGGILLVQPEQIFSFQLMGIERTLSGDLKVSQPLLNIQHFFENSSRDIVDESDENFSVKFELVYTMGTQRPVDFSPQRWQLIQAVLRLIRRLAPSIKQELPLSIETEVGPPGSFPRTRLLREDAIEMLCRRLAENICSAGIVGFPVARQPAIVRAAVLKYITQPVLSPEELSVVESRFWIESTKHALLLLRGLIAGGVVGFALGSKRWRVNYGLDGSRQPPTQLAVPYRAKDSPALRSEFSHPDVVITLTCLSHYYGGLADSDLRTAFEHLLKSDQAESEFQEWVQDASSLPQAFKNLIGINLQDEVQCADQVFPCLRHGKAVVDFFLSHVVFPKAMKEFPDKLSASGWDLGKVKIHPTTGFSGTNDSQHLLPLSVEHLDLEDQKHTNALVLHHLLQPETAVCLMPASNSECSDAERLLKLAMHLPRPPQVILDVGAQILELSNIEVARAWLKTAQLHNTNKRAVVFFNEQDELSVLDQHDRVEAFQISPYANQLDLCLVFLDEAHTRGTDLKLPEYYRAVVTLGANLTKDRLVQGKSCLPLFLISILTRW